MKTIFLCLIVIVARQYTAQTTETLVAGKSSPEIGVNLYMLNTAEGQSLLDNGLKFNQQYCTGFYYKHYFGKHVLRHAFNYSESSKVYNVPYLNQFVMGYYSYRKAVIHAAEIRSGYQVMLRDKKLSPYLFTDLQYGYAQEEGEEITSSIESWSAYGGTRRAFLLRRHTLAINPGIGLRFLMGKAVTLNVETQLQNYMLIEKEILNGGKRKESHGLKLNPLQVTLGVMF